MARIITNITDQPNQVIDAISEDGNSFKLGLIYNNTQLLWYYTLKFIRPEGSFFTLGLEDGTDNPNPPRTLTVNYNVLHNYRNQLPFGLVCSSTDGEDPHLITDFISPDINLPPRIVLTILNQEELEVINELLKP